jgi:ferredoxin
VSRLLLDRSLCEGSGFCLDLAPDLFELQDDGTAAAAVENLSPERTEAAREAEGLCPVRAITVTD